MTKKCKWYCDHYGVYIFTLGHCYGDNAYTNLLLAEAVPGKHWQSMFLKLPSVSCLQVNFLGFSSCIFGFIVQPCQERSFIF